MNLSFHKLVDVSRWMAIATSALALSVGVISSAQAQFVDPEPSAPDSDSVVTNTGRYVPPDRSAPQPGSTVPGTTRGDGCSAAATTGLVPLAPQTHTGQTQTLQPTIAWFTPETQGYTLEFRIAEHLSDGRFNILYETEFPLTENTRPSGITVVSLSDTDFTLSAEQTYRWQAVLVCNPNRPSESLVAEADLHVVAADERLVANLVNITDPVERANLYAAHSLWYDALAEVLMVDSDTAKSVQLSLLNDLAAIEEAAIADNQTRGAEPYDERLRAVIEEIQTDAAQPD